MNNFQSIRTILQILMNHVVHINVQLILMDGSVKCHILVIEVITQCRKPQINTALLHKDRHRSQVKTTQNHMK